eukprot:2802311-Prorocentrum_lima.AAC.1
MAELTPRGITRKARVGALEGEEGRSSASSSSTTPIANLGFPSPLPTPQPTAKGGVPQQESLTNQPAKGVGK